MTEPDAVTILFSDQWRRMRVRRGDALLIQADEITKEINETMKKDGFVHSATVMGLVARAQCLIAAAHAHYAAANVQSHPDWVE